MILIDSYIRKSWQTGKQFIDEISRPVADWLHDSPIKNTALKTIISNLKIRDSNGTWVSGEIKE